MPNALALSAEIRDRFHTKTFPIVNRTQRSASPSPDSVRCSDARASTSSLRYRQPKAYYIA